MRTSLPWIASSVVTPMPKVYSAEPQHGLCNCRPFSYPRDRWYMRAHHRGSEPLAMDERQAVSDLCSLATANVWRPGARWLGSRCNAGNIGVGGRSLLPSSDITDTLDAGGSSHLGKILHDRARLLVRVCPSIETISTPSRKRAWRSQAHPRSSSANRPHGSRDCS